MFTTFAVISLSLDYRVGLVGSFVTSQSRVARVLDALLKLLDGMFLIGLRRAAPDGQVLNA
jgi:hypothetical protein